MPAIKEEDRTALGENKQMTEDSRSSWRELNTAVVLLRIVEIRGLEIAFWT